MKNLVYEYVRSAIALRKTEENKGDAQIHYRKKWFLNIVFNRLFFNTLIQLHFDCACAMCCPNLTRALK